MQLVRGKDYDIIDYDENSSKIERVYNGDKVSIVKVINENGKVSKVLYHDENGVLSNISMYNVNTGKETQNITFKANGKTISSIRVYNEDTNALEKVAFYKEDGSVSTLVLYDKLGIEAQCSMFCDNGEVIKFNI